MIKAFKASEPILPWNSQTWIRIQTPCSWEGAPYGSVMIILSLRYAKGIVKKSSIIVILKNEFYLIKWQKEKCRRSGTGENLTFS